MSETTENQTDAEFEAEMSAISTVYSLRPGSVLTEQDFKAIQAFDKASRRDQERATDAYQRGYQDGLARGSNADVAALVNDRDAKSVNLIAQKALRKMDGQEIKRLCGLIVKLSDALSEGGGNWSNYTFDRLRRDVAKAVPLAELPDWLHAYRAD